MFTVESRNNDMFITEKPSQNEKEQKKMKIMTKKRQLWRKEQEIFLIVLKKKK